MHKSLKTLMLLICLSILVNCGITDRAAQVRETINTIEEISQQLPSGSTDTPDSDSGGSNSGGSSEDKLHDALNKAVDPVTTEQFLSALPSYRLVSVTTATTKNDNDTQTSTTRFIEERIAEPNILRTVVENGDNTTETYFQEKTLHTFKDGTCSVTGINAENWELPLRIARAMIGTTSFLIIAGSGTPKLVDRNVSMNGQSTDYYTVASNLMGMKSNGEFWIREDGLLVKAITHSEMAGKVTTDVTYSLEAVGEIDAITLPAECPALESLSSSSLPMPDDAEISLQTEQQISFLSNLSFQELVDFYKERLTAEGYEIVNVAESDTQAQLSASNEEYYLNVMIGENEAGKGSVFIMIDKR